MKKLIYLVMFAALAALTACSSFVKEPQVTVKDLNVVSLDGGGAVMELCLGVNNPNSFDIKLLGYSYDLKVMALPLAKGGARDEVNFTSNGETDFRIPIRISYGDLLEILKRRPDPDNIPYQLQAGLEVETPWGNRSVPVNRKGTYAIPKQYRPSALLNKITGFFSR